MEEKEKEAIQIYTRISPELAERIDAIRARLSLSQKNTRRKKGTCYLLPHLLHISGRGEQARRREAMTTHITTNWYSATCQAIADAISASIHRDEIVTMDHTDAVEAELLAECEGSQDDDPDGPTYWGQDLDGQQWTVRLV